MRATERVSLEPGANGSDQNWVAPGTPYSNVSSRWVQSSRSERAFLICGAIIIAVFVAAAIAPQLFTRQNPDALYAGPRWWARAFRTGSVLTNWAAISTPVWSMPPELR